ncbi:phosphatase PAP2 family protein [Chloroflexota bacterium]
MKNIMLWISAVVFVILAIIFAFTDLPIMLKVGNPGSGWGRFMQAYGQLPGMLVGFFGGSILLRLTKPGKSFRSVGTAVGFFILTTFLAFGFWGDALGQQIDAEVNYLLVLGLGVISLLIVQVWFRRIPDQTMQRYKVFGQIAVLLFFLAGLITVWSIKIPWGRWTYRDMLEVGDLSIFTPWYLPQGNNGHHSFISGHTALAFCVLPVVLLFKENKKHYQIAWTLALIWGVIGAISRVAIGAHFPSDVLFGGGQTLLWFWKLRQNFLTDSK